MDYSINITNPRHHTIVHWHFGGSGGGEKGKKNTSFNATYWQSDKDQKFELKTNISWEKGSSSYFTENFNFLEMLY